MKWASAFAVLMLGPALLRASDAPSLLLPAKEKTLQLQITIQLNGQPPEKAHNAFLDRLFDFFDRDGNGTLSAEEVERLFSLPGADGRGIAMNFKKLDADGDGNGSRSEFKAFYREAGFTPIVAIFAPGGAEVARAGAVLFKRLDRNGDGKLSRAELQKAPDVLRWFDADEDEVLTVAELLSDAANPDEKGKGAQAVTWSASPSKHPPEGILSISPGKVELRDVVDTEFEKVADEFHFAGGSLRVNAFALDLSARLQASRAFYLVPFKSALGDKPALEKKAIDDDASLAFLAPLFSFADRDGDQRLSLAELENFLDLIEAGVRSQIVVRIIDEGASLLSALDENRDGQLELRELNHADRLLPKGRDTLARQDIPRRINVAIEHGSAGKTFGPLLIVGKSKVAVAKSKAAPTGPKWFQAMDRNGDGLLSPGEFLGPPELFAALDMDHDGFISVVEAQHAKP